MTHEAAVSCAEGVKWNLYRNTADIRARRSLVSVALFLGSKVLYTNYSSRIRTRCPAVGPWQLRRETFTSGHCGVFCPAKLLPRGAWPLSSCVFAREKDSSLNALIHLLFLKRLVCLWAVLLLSVLHAASCLCPCSRFIAASPPHTCRRENLMPFCRILLSPDRISSSP